MSIESSFGQEWVGWPLSAMPLAAAASLPVDVGSAVAAAVTAFTGTGCLFAAAYGSYWWALSGLGAFIVGGASRLIADHLAAGR
jgi:hypothetical protein